MAWISKAIFWIVAAFYAFGALVHVMNILGLSGYSWPRAPLKWQVLDVTYLLLDILVVVGLIFAWRIGLIAFFIAATSQIFLYTVLRSWITDVPDEFARPPEEASSLGGLVIFHVVTIALIVVALWLRPSAN